jgi:UDP-N-acetylglucosamine 2-epimerase (non-hydrolysing)
VNRERRLVHVVGTRPNIVKMAPVIGELRRRFPDARHVIVHTGQHYDRLMSEIFLEELGVPEPDHLLGAGSGTHAEQTARVMERIEPVIALERPDVVIVPGDVNSTLAVALVAAKLQAPLAHVESGLRSFDRTMPEEVNRIVADQFGAHLFVHCDDAIDNLRAEGIEDHRIHFVGNTMIDTLVAMKERYLEIRAAERLGLEPGGYLLVTLHRPALVDGPLILAVLEQLEAIARDLPVVFPMHPRTRRGIADAAAQRRVLLLDPVGYLDFLSLEADAAAVLTDSGGVQEETTYLGVPCFTLRENTERPITVTAGTNTLLGLDPARIADILPALDGSSPQALEPPPMWDGRAAARIGDVFERVLGPEPLVLG